MAKVASGRPGSHFDPMHPQGFVLYELKTVLVNRAPETWPARARIEFGQGGEERVSVKGIHVDAGFMLIPVRIPEGRFGGGFDKGGILTGCQFFF